MRLRFVAPLALMSAACFSDPPSEDDAGGATTDATSTSAPATTSTTAVDPPTTSPDATGDSTGAPSGGMRQTLTLDTSDVAERLADIPVLIRLDPSVVDYDGMLADRADVRFFSDSGTPLPHEIEAWTPGGETIVWVRLAEVAAGASTTGMPDLTASPLRIGTMNLQADLDEVRISAVVRSDGWLRLQARAVEPDFAVFGPAEPG